MRSDDSEAPRPVSCLSHASALRFSIRPLVLAVSLGVLGGCGGPSNTRIEHAVMRWCRQHGVHESLIRTPPGMGITRYGNQRISSLRVRVAKRGKPFSSWVRQRVWPVRVHMEGRVLVRYGRWTGPPGSFNRYLEEIRKGELPFEGHADFHIWYEPGDETKVDPDPGTWRAAPLP